jgi:pimeloyl-ACP methyl ester carboxylesterase
MSEPTLERRELRYGMFDVPIRWAGRGRPLLFLHDVWGLVGGWNPRGALARLAEEHLVMAPSHPGYDGATGLEHLDDLLDLSLYYLDLLDELLIDSPYLVGHGFGGMIAAEMAALAPQRIAKLILVAPYGLWIEAAPVADVFALRPEELAQAAWFNPAAAPPPPDDPELRLQQAQNLSAAAKFLWPIPEKGLRKRLHRLVAPTLLVWGERDQVVPPVYGEAFNKRIPNSRLVTIPNAAHFPHLEQPNAFARVALEFLEG